MTPPLRCNSHLTPPSVSRARLRRSTPRYPKIFWPPSAASEKSCFEHIFDENRCFLRRKLLKIFWPPPAARKIGYFGLSNRDFTREIGHLEVSKPQIFPAAEGGRKNRYFGTPKPSFSGGKTLRNWSQTEPDCPKSVSSRNPLVFG